MGRHNQANARVPPGVAPLVFDFLCSPFLQPQASGLKGSARIQSTFPYLSPSTSEKKKMNCAADLDTSLNGSDPCLWVGSSQYQFVLQKP